MRGPAWRRAILGLLAGGAVACTGWIEDDGLVAPEAPIEAAHGYAIVPAAPVAPEAEVDAEAEAPRDPAPRCETTMEYMESEDGTTPRQLAMFAPGMERHPWPRIRRWFAAAGVTLPEAADVYEFGGLELGRALGEPGASYDCVQIVELAGRDAAVCTRSAIVEHAVVHGREALAVDWVLVFPSPEGLVRVVVGPQVNGGIGFDTALDPPLALLPYVRLDLVVVDAARGRLRIEEAAPGACDYACAHAREVERRNVREDPLAARETIDVAETCGAIGEYVVRGTTVARGRERSVARDVGAEPLGTDDR